MLPQIKFLTTNAHNVLVYNLRRLTCCTAMDSKIEIRYFENFISKVKQYIVHDILSRKTDISYHYEFEIRNRFFFCFERQATSPHSQTDFPLSNLGKIGFILFWGTGSP